MLLDKETSLPPSYTDAQANSDDASFDHLLRYPGTSFPHTTFSSSFRTPLVLPNHVKGHLNLLAAFYGLRLAVQRLEGTDLPEEVSTLYATERWAWFVTLAVERFD
jgi:hypothetical protein